MRSELNTARGSANQTHVVLGINPCFAAAGFVADKAGFFANRREKFPRARGASELEFLATDSIRGKVLCPGGEKITGSRLQQESQKESQKRCAWYGRWQGRLLAMLYRPVYVRSGFVKPNLKLKRSGWSVALVSGWPKELESARKKPRPAKRTATRFRIIIDLQGLKEG